MAISVYFPAAAESPGRIQKKGFTLGLNNLDHRSIGIQGWGSCTISYDAIPYYTIPYWTIEHIITALGFHFWILPGLWVVWMSEFRLSNFWTRHASLKEPPQGKAAGGRVL